jgi:hypothetical protein
MKSPDFLIKLGLDHNCKVKGDLNLIRKLFFFSFNTLPFGKGYPSIGSSFLVPSVNGCVGWGVLVAAL